jgi:hypothetical protein
LLLRDKHFKIASSERCRNRSVEQRLGEAAIAECKWLIRIVVGTFAALITQNDADNSVRVGHRT